MRTLTEFISVTAIGVIPSLQSPQRWYWLAVPILVYLALKVYEHLNSINERQRSVKGQLAVLYKLLPFDNESHVRCTYHVPVLPRKLRQAFDYVPFGGGGGRKFQKRKGIIGVVFDAKDVRVENFESDRTFRDRMRKVYRYSERDLQKITLDRRSYLCIPIKDENLQVLGLLYFDSASCNTFELDPPNPVTKAILDASGMIRDSML
jgi:GAF domain-containing protein